MSKLGRSERLRVVRRGDVVVRGHRCPLSATGWCQGQLTVHLLSDIETPRTPKHGTASDATPMKFDCPCTMICVPWSSRRCAIMGRHGATSEQ